MGAHFSNLRSTRAPRIGKSRHCADTASAKVRCLTATRRVRGWREGAMDRRRSSYRACRQHHMSGMQQGCRNVQEQQTNYRAMLARAPLDLTRITKLRAQEVVGNLSESLGMVEEG